VKASARLVAEALPDGSTRLTTLAGQAPLLLRQTDTDDETGCLFGTVEPAVCSTAPDRGLVATLREETELEAEIVRDQVLPPQPV